MLGQMMEPLVKTSKKSHKPAEFKKEWALTGCKGRAPNIAKSFYMKEGDLEKLNLGLQKKYQLIQNKEERYEGLFLKDASVVLVAYGTMARIAKVALHVLRKEGIRVGFLRPITLWPFPKKVLRANVSSKTRYLVIEMSYGQMVEDVRLAVEGKNQVEFLGRAGGGIPSEEEIIKKVREIL